MNIIIAMCSWSYRGGEKITLNLAKCLADRGHEVEVITARKEPGFHKKNGNYKIVYPTRFKSLLKTNLLAYIFGIFYVFFSVKKRLNRADLIISESDANLIGSYLAVITSKKKLMWYAFDYNQNRSKNKVVQYLWKLIHGNLERIAVSRVNKVLTLAEPTKKLIDKKFGKKSSILPPIVKIDTASHAKITIPEKKLIDFYRNRKVLFLPATLHFMKNQELAIKMLATKQKRIPDLGLVLAGEGSDKKRLLDIVKKFKVENNVFFAGILQGEALRFAYKNAFATLVCSNTTSEGFSLTAIESLCYKTPVIVSSIAGISGFLTDNKIGLVAQPNIKSFLNALDNLYKNYAKYKKQTGKVGLLVKANFSEDVIYKRFLNIV